MAATGAIEPGHSRAATCWSPDEEGTWSRSARCLHGSSSSSLGELVLLEGRRGERGLLLIKLLCPHRETHVGCCGQLAPSPEMSLRAALAQSPCALFLRCCTSPLLLLPLSSLLGGGDVGVAGPRESWGAGAGLHPPLAMFLITRQSSVLHA